MNGSVTVYQWSFLDQILGGCVLCGAPGTTLCPGCRADLPYLGPACECCAMPLAATTVCGACLRNPPPIDRALVPFFYEPPLSDLILRLKFSKRLYLAPLLGRLLMEKLVQRDLPWPDTVLPVPLHPVRLAERGYNQALELARPLVQLGLTVDAGLLRRVRLTAAQSALDYNERQRNVRGAFAVHGPVPRSVALLDDVITTGATLTELARVLKRAGAERVEIWALARTVAGGNR